VVTATQIIEQALGEIGAKAIGQTVSGSELQDCFERLNAMVDAWRGQNLFAVASIVIPGTLLAGAISAGIGQTVGPAVQAFVADPPTALLEGCYYRLNGVDFPIRVVTFAEYQAIEFKTLTAAGPSVVYLAQDYPIASVRFWPAPSSSINVRLAMSSRITQFVDLTTQYEFAPGYRRALFLSLAEELAAPYQTDLPAMTVRNASTARRAIKRQNVDVPMLTLDDRLPGFGDSYLVRRGVL
jgi:hypothetical protein